MAGPEQIRRAGATHPSAVQIGKQVRLRVAGGDDHRVAGDRLDSLDLPLGRMVEGLVGAELDHRAPDVLVPELDVDIARARRVCLARERPGERRVLDLRPDEGVLAGSDIRTDAHRHCRVALETV